MDTRRANNQQLWNEWTAVHVRSKMYRLKQFKAGENQLHPLELEEVGPVGGLSLLHLQCHFGLDTLSWARLGARVTGVDFSDAAIGLANQLSTELNLPARFINCDIYDLPAHLDEQFDIVFTSYGVLSWLSDLHTWAQLAARYVKPGGFFYIAEMHPFGMMLDDEAQQPRLRYPYFDNGVQVCDVQGSYADKTAEVKTKAAYEYPYTLGGVITELCNAGLTIEYVHEFPYGVFPQLAYLREVELNHWVQPEDQPQVPLLFSIKAKKDH